MKSVTIIIPAYNSAKYITKPLESLTSQTYINYDVLIIDDGSTDETKEVITRYTNLDNFKYIKKINGNWGSVINYVIKNKLAKGDYITILDSDDWFENDCLEQVNKVKGNPDIIVTSINKNEKNKNKRMKPYFKIRSGYINKKIAHTPISTPHGKFYKNKLFHELNPLREGVPFQDTILFNELSLNANNIYFLNKKLATWWRDREGNTTTNDWNQARVDMWFDICEKLSTFKNPYINAWIIMYLWEMNRNTKINVKNILTLQEKKIKFNWIPFGLRAIAKLYFLIKTKRYLRQEK